LSHDQDLALTFVELADTLVDEFDALDFMHTLTDRVVHLLDAEAAGVILADQRGGLQVVASTSQEARVLEVFQVQNGEGGPCVECYATGAPLVNLDVDQVADRWPRFHQACLAAGFTSSHALPMRLRDQIIGALNLYCADQSVLTPDDVALGQAMADVATIGLLQERSIRQHEVLSEQLQTALHGRVLIEQAKGVFAERAGISVHDAFTRLRAHARRNRLPLTGVAAAVLDGSLDVAVLIEG
jgi:transcriptional regulator with GAF, ATPase, and Fis domain